MKIKNKITIMLSAVLLGIQTMPVFFMYDGTVIYEELITYEGHSLGGYFDDNAAASMTNEVINMLNSSGVYSPFVADYSYYEDAKYFAFWYALKAGSNSAPCAQAYHSSHGGLPNVSDNRKYITLSDGCNDNNYIGCFVYDAWGSNNDTSNFIYGQYWCSHFGTYYASSNF